MLKHVFASLAPRLRFLLIALAALSSSAIAAPTVGTIACNPPDTKPLANTAASLTVKPEGVKKGDLVWMVVAARSGSTTFSVLAGDGQTWNENAYTGNAIPVRKTFWTVFNGRWNVDPGVAVQGLDSSAISLCIVGISPSAGKAWAADVAQVDSVVTAATPHTITGQLATAPGITLASFISDSSAREWRQLTPTSWNVFGDGNIANTTGSGLTLGLVYKVNTAAGATGNVSYTPNVSSRARMSIQTWKEVASTSNPPPAEPVKFRPGHYMWSTPKSFGKEGRNLTNILNDAAEVCGAPNLRGMQITIGMGSLEGEKGVYSSKEGDALLWGFAAIDKILKALECGSAPDKYLMLNVSDSIYAAIGDSGRSTYFPAYLLNSAEYACGNTQKQNGVVTPRDVNDEPAQWTGGLGAVVCMWKAPVMDRLIALRKAYGERYDSKEQFEMISAGGETAIGADSDSGFNYPEFIVQLKRQMEATSKAWPTTTIRLPANFTGKESQMIDLLDFCASLPNCAAGGPDPELPLPLPDQKGRPIQANEVMRGMRQKPCPNGTCIGFEWWENTGIDRRNSIPWVGEQQDLGIDTDKESAKTMQDIQDYQKKTMHMRWMIWIKGTKWTELLRQINSDHSVYDPSSELVNPPPYCPYEACTP